jgi:hypothetical protein
MQALGAYAKEIVLAKPDKRTREGRLLKQVREKLTEQLGGRLTPAQRALIERAAYPQLRCAMLDKRIIAGEFTDFDSKQYLAWANALRRALKDLGLNAAAPAQPTLTDVLADLDTRRARGAA